MLLLALAGQRRAHTIAHVHPVGFTLVELLVSIGVIGLLAAIILPAIQNSRETSRRATCSSHIRQLAIACQNHATTHGAYPEGAPLEKLLPFVEGRMPNTDTDPQVEVYQCPAETHPDWGSPWSVNYYMNNGSHIYFTPDSVTPQGGIVSYYKGVRPRDIADGESNTAMFSERQLAPIETRGMTRDAVAEIYRTYPLFCVWRTGSTFLHGQEDEFMSACGDASRRQPQKHIVPANNHSLRDSDTFYKHVLPPNVPGCAYIEPPKLSPYWVLGEWDTPANSGHPGGVNLALCDGVTRFVANPIDLHVWRAIGTRDGAETVGPY